jgi:class 3 adenylate cyclase
MTCEASLDQARAMRQRRGRLPSGARQRPCQRDAASLAAWQAARIEGQRLAVAAAGRVRVWSGAEVSAPAPTAPPVRSPDRLPRADTPPSLAEPSLTSNSILAGERKQGTGRCADLTGAMALRADREPEDARRRLDPVLERRMAAVHRDEGTGNQGLGDGIMALFGAPLAHADHPGRACSAALAMQGAIRTSAEAVRRTPGVTVQMRGGLNAGAGVVRAMGHDRPLDDTAGGQTTQVAARMEPRAQPGST